MTTKTFEYPNCTVRVHIPELSEDERQKRQKALYYATEKFLRAMEGVKKDGRTVDIARESNT